MTNADIYPAIVALALALGTTRLISPRSSPTDDSKARFTTIDGLRGYLAFGVFIYHGMIWNEYRVTGEWRPAASGSRSHRWHSC